VGDQVGGTVANLCQQAVVDVDVTRRRRQSEQERIPEVGQRGNSALKAVADVVTLYQGHQRRPIGLRQRLESNFEVERQRNARIGLVEVIHRPEKSAELVRFRIVEDTKREKGPVFLMESESKRRHLVGREVLESRKCYVALFVNLIVSTGKLR
jgi:hypothetical protein